MAVVHHSRFNCTRRRSHDGTVNSGPENCSHSVNSGLNTICRIIIFRLALFPYNQVLDMKSGYSSYLTGKMSALHTTPPPHTLSLSPPPPHAVSVSSRIDVLSSTFNFLQNFFSRVCCCLLACLPPNKTRGTEGLAARM